jgi:hypothetical protein
MPIVNIFVLFEIDNTKHPSVDNAPNRIIQYKKFDLSLNIPAETPDTPLKILDKLYINPIVRILILRLSETKYKVNPKIIWAESLNACA